MSGMLQAQPPDRRSRLGQLLPRTLGLTGAFVLPRLLVCVLAPDPQRISDTGHNSQVGHKLLPPDIAPTTITPRFRPCPPRRPVHGEGSISATAKGAVVNPKFGRSAITISRYLNGLRRLCGYGFCLQLDLRDEFERASLLAICGEASQVAAGRQQAPAQERVAIGEPVSGAVCKPAADGLTLHPVGSVLVSANRSAATRPKRKVTALRRLAWSMVRGDGRRMAPP